MYKIKPREVDLFMDIAARAALMSRATRLKVGAVIVKDGRVLSLSWNGTPPGWDNNCEDVIGVTSYGQILTKTKPEVIHAEANAVIKLARDGESGKDATLFCTHAPCIDCAKMIYGAGIKTVYYRDVYKNEFGIEFLKKCPDIEVVHLIVEPGS